MDEPIQFNFKETFLKITGTASRGLDLFGALEKGHGSGYKIIFFTDDLIFFIVPYTQRNLTFYLGTNRFEFSDLFCNSAVFAT